MTTSEMSPADFGAIMGNNCDGFGGGSWWIILLFLFAFAGGWNGGGYGNGGGVQDAYVLNSDFSQLSRQIDTATDRLASQGVQISNGLCDGFYTQAQLVNGTNTNILQSANAIQSQLASCCCDVRDSISQVNYNMAMNTNALQNAIQTGFCDTNYNAQNNTRDIIDSQNAGTRAILEAIQQNKVEALQEKIASLTADNQSLKFQASQSMQNAYIANLSDGIVNRLHPQPVPSYNVPNPYCGCYSCN